MEDTSLSGAGFEFLFPFVSQWYDYQVATYLLQGVVGLGITIITAMVIEGFFSAADVLLPFGYGQALNYGTIYETDFRFKGGKTFALTIAALGFLNVSIGGVIHLNLLTRKEKSI